MNQTTSAERIHIGFFGLRNAGKSSLVNVITGQELAVVSDVKGTTTDPVKKAMELLPLGPVVIIDTPGIDDEGALGELRVKKARQVLNYTDIAILVTDATTTFSPEEQNLVALFQKKEIPYLIVRNKSDLLKQGTADVWESEQQEQFLCVSTITKENIETLKNRIAAIGMQKENNKKIVSDLIASKDIVVLVTPIDKSAPKGRLILPQQQTIRDILDAGAIAMVTKETELQETLDSLKYPPKMVITDSQAFKKVAAIVPKEIPLTSFSILFMRYKGSLESMAAGAQVLEALEDGDKILISEGCTHHRQCGDIGTEKLPNWIRAYSGKKVEFIFTSGMEFPEELDSYRLIIHCGGCMLNEREMQYRIRQAKDQGIPITNYGVSIAKMNGILERSLELFK